MNRMATSKEAQRASMNAQVNVEQPFRLEHPEYMAYEDRLHTHKLWPKESSHRSETLVETGFYYNCKEDEVYYFCCDCELSPLQPREDLWGRHVKLAPDCTYLRNRR
ncbi:hypothetical protein TSAR_004064 [Trichomalopsis sarcophagae]|uniref:Uncharacterized protein n=1 Tax=Trichomalopsis sarcophagae TaxID=543379 RepID=A0A232ENI1_9HYME|nr:hypothetical protein TSAR_004064 [Trichomalopsis sarcophagae]